MAGTLVFRIPRLEMAAVITGKQQDGVFRHMKTLQCIPDPSECLVQPFHHAVVSAQMLPGRTSQRP